ncbi:alpha/beta hydrolase [bacterium]|nr:alpha/beta hydrolase [bacterium]
MLLLEQMGNNKILWLVFLLGIAIQAFIVGCSEDNGTNSNGPSVEIPDSLTLEFEEPPFTLYSTSAQFARDVPYGEYEDNVFDIFLVESSEPTPLVVYIHGGGFTTGDKGVIYVSGQTEIREFLYNGVSFATINYRLLDSVDTEGVIKPMTDSKRCLQFLRYHHEQLNIDPSRLALYGASAGAGTCLWLAFSDDMAEPLSSDLILRESTRVPVVGAKGTQSTYDLLKWETVVFASLGLTLEDMANLPESSEQGFLSFYGIDSLEELSNPGMVAYRESVDMLELMTPDDPGFWVMNTIENTGIPTSQSELFHHTLHAVALLEQANDIGLECVAYVPPLEIADPSGVDIVEFLLDRLNGD